MVPEQPPHPPHMQPSAQLLRKFRLMPTWQGNLLAFGLLIGMVLVYFIWQARQANHIFLMQVQQGSRVLAGVIQLNARSAVLSENLFQQIMTTVLGNTARFVDYLDNVEPFSEKELAAFSGEAGLAGIRIQKPDGSIREGPARWLSGTPENCLPQHPQLVHLAGQHLYYLTYPRSRGDGCLIVGIATERIENLQRQIGLPALFETLSGLGGIRYVRLEEKPDKAPKSEQDPEILLINTAERQVAEIRRTMDDHVLVIGLEASYHFARVRRLWRELAVSGSLLALGGVFLSWVLYRLQTAYLENTRDFERKLARQREDAALGRATAAIAHEIRNPLNAISMGLQRLQMEANGLESAHSQLIASMQTAVRRTNRIITDLRRFAKPLHPRKNPVALHELVRQIETLYQAPCQTRGIAIRQLRMDPAVIVGDADLISECVENIIKNAVEAQPPNGAIELSLECEAGQAILQVTNGGATISPDQIDSMLEPYFTTKTRGSGLGLPIAARIVQAHGGQLRVWQPEPETICIEIRLPTDAGTRMHHSGS